MALNKLNDVTLRKSDLKPGRYSDGGNLYLNVSKNGTKSWVFMYSRSKQPRREMGLGAYPGLSLAAARQKALDVKRILAAGEDPLEVLRKPTERNPEGPTAITEIERLRAKLVAAEAEVGKVISDSFKRAAEITARAEAAETRLASAKEVIAPFAEFGRSHTDEHGWIDGFGNERICNWIGPSDLRAAAEWMDKCDE